MWLGLLTTGLAQIPPPVAQFHVAASEWLSPTMRVVILPEPGRATIAAEWVFALGANDDPEDMGGLHHLVEHLAFGPISGGEDYDQQLGKIGGESHGWTDRERMGWGATVPARIGAGSTLRQLLELETARWTGLSITAESLERQAGVLRQEDAERASGLHARNRQQLSSLLWSGSTGWARHPQAPAASPIANSGPATGTTLLAAAQQIWINLHDPKIATLVVAGGFELIDAFSVFAELELQGPLPLDSAARSLDQREAGMAAPSAPACEAAAPTRKFTSGTGRDTTILFAWPTRGRDHADRVSLELIARWMGGARLSTGVQCGEFVVERRDRQRGLGRHAAALRRSIDAIIRDGLSAPQVQATALAQVTDYARALDNPQLQARIVAGCVLAHGDPSCVPAEVEAWMAVTPESTQRAAARWLEWEAVTLLATELRNGILWPPIRDLRPW